MNSFGPYATQRYPLYDVREAIESRRRFRRRVIPALERANSFYCPSGRYPSKGWILLSRKDYNNISKYSTSLQLEIGDSREADNVSVLKNLSIVQAQCVTRGLVNDENALYLIELTDKRGLLYNEWFKFPLNAQYNIRSPAYPQTFIRSSMNSGVPVTTTWTWATMIRDIWERMSTFLGTWPGLPYAPAGTPEGFWFSGVPAWTTLCDLLDHIGMRVACNLTQNEPFTIVRLDTTDTAFTALTTRYETHLEDDLEWIDIGAGRVPRTVKVLFRRRNSVYSTEETMPYRNDAMAEQWSMKHVYEVSVDAPASFSSAVGTHYIWSDFTVRYDDSSNPLDADITMARLIARERVTQYYANIDPSSYISRTYAGALPFTTGAQVDGVCWYQNHTSRDWYGWRTNVVSGPAPPWPEIYSQN